jgi:hypothetical protein
MKFIKGLRVRFGTCMAGGILAAIAVTSGSAYMVPAAEAATCPAGSSCADANVTVNQTISFAFTSATSFALDPAGVVNHSALAFTITTNDSHGYHVTLAAPDLTTGNATIPATDLSYSTYTGGSQVGNTNQLSNTAADFLDDTHSTGGTGYTQDWAANVPGNTSPGVYQTTLTFVATGA